MAFIPNLNLPSNRVFGRFPLSRDVISSKGTITKTSIVEVLGVTDRGYDIIDIESGEEMYECGFDIFDYKTS